MENESVTEWNYESLRTLVQSETFPLMLVDLKALDENVRRLASIAIKHKKSIRLATKSVRVPNLISRILETGFPAFKGLMCYSPREALFLSKLGFDDFLIAYPNLNKNDLECVKLVQKSGKKIITMVDSVEHLRAIQEVADVPLGVCIDVDMSYRFGRLHLGVQRSPIRSLESLKRFIQCVHQYPKIQLKGLMAYEAQIAGLPDKSPHSVILNPFKRFLKTLSQRDVFKRRESIAKYLNEENIHLDLFNAGGTGSLKTTALESWITEVTVGSGCLQSVLFDHFIDNENRPAFCFGLEVTRKPETNIITCHGGGFVASGEVSLDKLPVPFLPNGLSPLKREHFGEVQTPLRNKSSVHLNPGMPVFFRPAKAGEIAEHFQEYLLIENGKIIERAKTYRGMNFL